MRKLRRIQFTKDGFEKLKKEFEDLKAKRPDAVATLKQAREMGDLSENGLYKAARARLSSIDFNLRRLDQTVKLAYVVSPVTNETVGLGSKVVVKQGDVEKTFILVGGYEADPSQNKVSVYSPIGRALQGKKVGDLVSINIPKGSISYLITAIIIQ